MFSTLENRSACFQPISKLSILNIAPSILTEEDLKRKVENEVSKCEDRPIRRLSLQCLSRGPATIKNLFRHFNSLGKDDVTLDELKAGLSAFGLEISDADSRKVLVKASNGMAGQISFQRFFEELRPPVNPIRAALIRLVFEKMDKGCQEAVSVEAMRDIFNHRKDPRFLSGEKSIDELFNEFTSTFDLSPHKDDEISKEDFFNYYAAKSVSIAGDIYFDLMMRNSWTIT